MWRALQSASPWLVPVVVPVVVPVAVPVAFKVEVAIMTRRHPLCAGVGGAGPVSVVPFIVVTHRVPVARYPGIACAGTSRLNSNYTQRWRCADSHADINCG